MTALEEKLSERYDRQIRLWGADAQQNISKSRALMCGLGAVNAEVHGLCPPRCRRAAFGSPCLRFGVAIAQVCKNLVLAGISATLQDDATVTAKDLSANFFLTMDDVGKNVRVLAPSAAVALPHLRPPQAMGFDVWLVRTPPRVPRLQRAAASLDRVRELNQFVSVESCEEGLTTLSDEFILKHNIVCMAGCGLADQVRRRRVWVRDARGRGDDVHIVSRRAPHVGRRRLALGASSCECSP